MKHSIYLGLLASLCIGCTDSIEKSENSVVNELTRSSSIESDGLYYYYNGEKVPLKVDKSSYYVCSLESEDIDATMYSSSQDAMVASTMGQTMQNVDNNDGEEKHYSFVKQTMGARSAMSTQAYMDKLHSKAQNTNTSVSPCLISDNGDDIYMAPEFYVKLKSLADTITLKNIASDYGISSWKQNKYMPLWFTLYVDTSCKLTSLEMSNEFYETGKFAKTSPAFVGASTFANTDTYYSTQWGLNNTGQYGGTSSKGIDIHYEGATNMATGINTIVGVIDLGIDYSHPDINCASYSYDAYKNTEYTNKANVYYNNAHGTCCAGIIAAEPDNSIGIVGVSPLSQVVSISVPIGAETSGTLANAFSWAKKKGISVLSCSWGGGSPSDIVTDAINDAATNGRNGYGCVIVFSTGNSNLSTISYPSSLENVISVGAIDTYGFRKTPTSLCGEDWGSNYGTGLDVVAPGILVSTTDITGSNGYNSGSTASSLQNTFSNVDFSDANYTKFFNGTSAATPFVSGLASLILSKHRTLKASDVKNIICSTCQKLSNYKFNTTSTYGTWNSEVGYGLIDAIGAVLYSYSYPETHVITGSDYVSTSATSFTVNKLPSSTSVQWSVNSSYFTVTRSGYNSAMVKSSASGKSATLKAEIVLAGTGEVIKTLTKTITSK